MQPGTTETGTDRRANADPRRHSLWARLRLGVGRVLGSGNEPTRSAHGAAHGYRPSADELEALLHDHATLTARVRTLELENSELRHAQAAQLIPQGATDAMQRACEALAGAVPDEKLLGVLLADCNRALGSSRVVLSFNAPLWTGTVLEQARVIPEKPRLVDERSLTDLYEQNHALPNGAGVSIPLAHGGSAHAILIAEIDGTGARFAPWQLQVVRIFAGIFCVALVVYSMHQRATHQLLLEQRGAVARKLHDSLLQSISLTRLQLGRLQSLAGRMGGSDELSHVVNEVRDGMDRSIAQVRELLAELRPPAPRKDAERERR